MAPKISTVWGPLQSENHPTWEPLVRIFILTTYSKFYSTLKASKSDSKHLSFNRYKGISSGK